MRTFVWDPYVAELGERQRLNNGRVEHVTAVPVRQLMVEQGKGEVGRIELGNGIQPSYDPGNGVQQSFELRNDISNHLTRKPSTSRNRH